MAIKPTPPSSIKQKAPTNLGGTVPVAEQVPVTSAGQTWANGPTAPTATNTNSYEITRFQFRKLFTQTERITIDNAQYNANFSGSVKAAIYTMQKDMEVSAVVNLKLSDTIAGINFLVKVGILTSDRALRILANLPPL